MTDAITLKSSKQDIIDSKEFRDFFLYKFVKTLIKQSQAEEVIELETELKEKLKKRIKEAPRLVKKIQPVPLKRRVVSAMVEETFHLPQEKLIKSPETFYQKGAARPRLPTPVDLSRPVRIPELRLPPRLQHIRPTPTKMEMDLGRVNPLIANPMVNAVECSGPNTKITVKTKTGETKTGVILTEKEIEDILKTFFEKARIPFEEGVHKIVRGNLILSAIISDTVGSKFIIRKMAAAPIAPPQMPPQPPRPPAPRFPR